jgi:hypothetical protein
MRENLPQSPFKTAVSLWEAGCFQRGTNHQKSMARKLL